LRGTFFDNVGIIACHFPLVNPFFEVFLFFCVFCGDTSRFLSFSRFCSFFQTFDRKILFVNILLTREKAFREKAQKTRRILLLLCKKEKDKKSCFSY